SLFPDRVRSQSHTLSLHDAVPIWLGNGLADVRGMLERKVNVGIGTDGANCSDNLNMYESMRLASMVSKTQGPDTDRWLATGEVRSEEHTSELQSRENLVCRLLLEK